MCACDVGFVCARCRATPFAEAVDAHAPLTASEWDDLLASEQHATAEPYAGRQAEA